jgi:hypothetical protein
MRPLIEVGDKGNHARVVKKINEITTRLDDQIVKKTP